MKRTKKKQASSELEAALKILPRDEAPLIPTAIVSRTGDGRLVGDDGSVWAVYKAPLSPVADAKTQKLQLAAGQPLDEAIREISDMTNVGIIKRRRMAKESYRPIHVLAVNLPAYFTPPRDHPLYDFLASNFSHRTQDVRLSLFAVRLESTFIQGGLRGTIESVVDKLISPDVDMREYARDFEKMNAAMARCGLFKPSIDETRVVEAWWNRGTSPATSMMGTPDALHVFRSIEASRQAKRLWEHEQDWTIWPRLDGHTALRFMMASEIDLGYTPASSLGTQWVSDLLNSGAIAVSIRALVEPPLVTARELDAQEKNYRDDVKERHHRGQMSKVEQDEKLDLIGYLKNAYSGNSGPPTLADMTVVAAFPASAGRAEDISAKLGTVTLTEMEHAHPVGMAHTWLCASGRGIPYRLELPSTALAHSGVCALSNVGDDPKGAALLGFTENGRQPAWCHPAAAFSKESPPIELIAGMSGSGKTMTLLWKLIQFALAGHPVVMVNPKQSTDESDFAELALYVGGTVYSLDQMVSDDPASSGIFDPMRFSKTPHAGLDLAADLLSNINPWGSRREDFETDVMIALKYGADQGADCIGEALEIALRDGRAGPDGQYWVDKVLYTARAQPLMAAMVGLQHGGPALGRMDGFNLIRVGETSLPLPDEGEKSPSLIQRIALTLVQTIVSGSATAVRDRYGAVGLDEAWIYLGASARQLKSLGRVARSQRTAVLLATQRVTDAVGIEDFISQGIILPMNSEEEARAACKLVNLEATDARIERITASATKGGLGNQVSPNFNSLRTLYEPGTRDVIRGTVGYYVDVHDRAIPTEVVLPQWFLEIASTNKEDRKPLAKTA